MGIPAYAIADLDFAFTHARVGSQALLAADAPEVEQAKVTLASLASTDAISLGDNGLPTKSKTGGPTAEEAWELFAAHREGSKTAGAVHSQLKDKSIWIWRQGCIETVTGLSGKGEVAIGAKEEWLLNNDPSAVGAAMPALKECLDWVRDQKVSPNELLVRLAEGRR